MFQRTMNSSLVLKSSTFENGKYQHFFAGDFAQGSRAGKGDWAKYCSFHMAMRTGFHFWSFQVPSCSPFHHSEIGFHFVIIWVQLNFSHLLWHNYPFDNTQTPSRQHPDTTQTDSIGEHWKKRQ